MCTARNGLKDLPILAQGLPAVILEGLPTVFFIRRPFYPLVVWRSGGLARRFASRTAGLSGMTSRP